ncbi:hypothetical protein WN51_10108, partial [Melipona quadrifasciata]
EYAHTRLREFGIFINAIHEFKNITTKLDLYIFLNSVNHVAKMYISAVDIVDNLQFQDYNIPRTDNAFCTIELYCKLFNLLTSGRRHAFSSLVDNEVSEMFAG